MQLGPERNPDPDRRIGRSEYKHAISTVQHRASELRPFTSIVYLWEKMVSILVCKIDLMFLLRSWRCGLAGLGVRNGKVTEVSDTTERGWEREDAHRSTFLVGV